VLKRSWAGEVRNVSLLVAIGVNESGYREILGICEGAKEDKTGWSAFLKHLKERGLKGVRLITSDACIGDPCGNGVVMGLDPRGDGFLAVKAGPGLNYDRIDKLYNGAQVYICGSRGDWFAIVYDRAGEWTAGCNVMSPWPRSMPYTGPCRWGWVHRRWIEVVAG
jgi:hypothetical protein